jgi:hypothetical protein
MLDGSKQLVYFEDLWQKRRPPTVPLRGARSFFHNELDPQNIRRPLNAEGPKTPSLILLLKMNEKVTESIGPPISRCDWHVGSPSSSAGLYKQNRWC